VRWGAGRWYLSAICTAMPGPAGPDRSRGTLPPLSRPSSRQSALRHDVAGEPLNLLVHLCHRVDWDHQRRAVINPHLLQFADPVDDGLRRADKVRDHLMAQIAASIGKRLAMSHQA